VAWKTVGGKHALLLPSNAGGIRGAVLRRGSAAS